jgi:hypothetical protein
MENFKSASFYNFTVETGVTFGKHKSVMVCNTVTGVKGITLDVKGSDGTLYTGHVKMPANETTYIPTRITGATAQTGVNLIFFN